MSGFMSSSTALSVFKFKQVQNITVEKLRQHAFATIPGALTSFGWTSIEDATDTKWQRSFPSIGEFIVFALRVDTKKIQAPVLKIHLQEAFRLEMEANKKDGKDFISRARKKELKDLHTAKLLSKAEPVPSTTDIAVDTSNGCVYIGTTSNTTLELLQNLFLDQFGEHLLPFNEQEDSLGFEAETLAATLVTMRKVFDNPQTVEYDAHNYTVSLSDNEALSLTKVGGKETVNSKGELDSVKTALEKGLQIVKLELKMEETVNTWSFTLNSNLSFSGLKTPAISKDKDDDPDAILLEKLYLISRVPGVIAKLFA